MLMPIIKQTIDKEVMISNLQPLAIIQVEIGKVIVSAVVFLAHL